MKGENPLISYGGYILHLPDPVSGRCCDMSYYEFILALILVTGYIICVKKKYPPYLPSTSGYNRVM